MLRATVIISSEIFRKLCFSVSTCISRYGWRPSSFVPVSDKLETHRSIATTYESPYLKNSNKLTNKYSVRKLYSARFLINTARQKTLRIDNEDIEEGCLIVQCDALEMIVHDSTTLTVIL